MKTFNPFGVAVLALVAVATSCVTNARPTVRGGKVYLVGVAGGG